VGKIGFTNFSKLNISLIFLSIETHFSGVRLPTAGSQSLTGQGFSVSKSDSGWLLYGAFSRDIKTLPEWEHIPFLKNPGEKE